MGKGLWEKITPREIFPGKKWRTGTNVNPAARTLSPPMGDKIPAYLNLGKENPSERNPR